MTDHQMSTAIRKKHRLPYRCDCGGIMEDAASFGRAWSGCKTCSPVVKIDVNKLKVRKP